MNGFFTKVISLSGFSLKMIHRLVPHIRHFRAERSVTGDHSFCESRNDGHLANSLNLLLFLPLKFSLIASFKKKWMQLFLYGICQCVQRSPNRVTNQHSDSMTVTNSYLIWKACHSKN